MALVARHSLVAAIERKLRSAVVEGRGLPTLGRMTGRAIRLLLASELFGMDIDMAGFANLGSAFELDLFLPWKRFVTFIASDGSMDAKQGEFCFRVIESGHFTPRPRVVAGLAAEHGPIGPAAFLPIAELSMMRVGVATGAGFVFKVKRKDFIRSSRGTHFMAFSATNGGVRAG